MPRPAPGTHSDQFRKRAIEARRQAEHAYDPALRCVLEGNANHWEGLAEQTEWADVTAPDAASNRLTAK
jgi:hypothetical protein